MQINLMLPKHLPAGDGNLEQWTAQKSLWRASELSIQSKWSELNLKDELAGYMAFFGKVLKAHNHKQLTEVLP